MKERSAIIKSYEMVVLVFGIITFGLVVALFIQIIRPWYLGALLGLGVSSLFGLIIFLGLRQHRVRRLIPKTTSPEESELEFLVTESPYGGMVSKKLKLSPLDSAPWYPAHEGAPRLRRAAGEIRIGLSSKSHRSLYR
jgi:hypothetical protein